jgi:predicted phage tail protein
MNQDTATHENLYANTLYLAETLLKEKKPDKTEIEALTKSINLASDVALYKKVDEKQFNELNSTYQTHIQPQLKTANKKELWGGIMMGIGMAVLIGSLIVGAALIVTGLGAGPGLAIALGGAAIGAAIMFGGQAMHYKGQSKRINAGRHFRFHQTVKTTAAKQGSLVQGDKENVDDKNISLNSSSEASTSSSEKSSKKKN